jgi:hypothetical protein
VRCYQLCHKDFRICDQRTGTSKDFADLRFAKSHLKTCGFAIGGPVHLRNLRRSNCRISSRIRWLAIFVQKFLAHLCIMVINPGFQVHTACRIQKRCKALPDTIETLVSFLYFFVFFCNRDHKMPIYFKDGKVHFRVVHIRIIIYVFVLSKKVILKFLCVPIKVLHWKV